MAVIPTRLERTLLGWGRVAAVLVLVLGAMAWVGWATGIQALTRVHPAWPPMTPWTALWLAALASAILVHSGRPSPARVWVGRGLAAAVAVTAAAVLAEYLTGRTFGLDQVWFGDAVRTMQATLPGRPSPPTAASVLLLSVAVALTRTSRRGFRAAWAGCLVAAMAFPFVTIVAYLFGAVARLEFAPSTGMAMTTAFGLLLLGVACLLVRPAWLLARSDRLSLIRLGMILAGFPLLVGLSRRAYLAVGLSDDLALTFATATATVVLGTAAYRLSRREHALLEASESDRTALRDNADSLLASERKYRLLAENVADVVYLVQDGKIAWVSGSVEQVSGAPPEYWVGRELREAIPPEDWAESAERNATVLTGGVVAARARGITVDGVIHWVDVRAKPYYETDGRQNGFVASLRVIDNEVAAQQELEEARRLLAASADSMLDPQMLLEGVRDPAGRVVDLRYREANEAACLDMGMARDELIGRTVLELRPGFAESGPMSYYVQCLETGQPGALDNYSYDNEVHADSRRYDVRIAPAGNDLISLSFRDVTDRFQAAQRALEAARRITESERAYRLLAENSGDMVIHVRDGRFAWSSPSVADVVGARPEYWVGRRVLEIIPPEDEAAFAARLATLAAGGTVQERIRVVAVDGVTHWADVHARPLRDDAGRQDGFTAALRLVDDEVAAQQDAKEARRQRARADALYRRSVDSAAVGMCLVNPEGGFVDVNEAVCEFFGYDADALKSKTWQALTAEADTRADMDNVADVMAGRIESYRVTKQYVHADGHPIWGDASVGCVRDRDGHVEVLIVQINDITAEVQSRQELLISEERNRALAQGLQAELSSAARYLQSVLPAEMAGQVSVSTRYLPSNILGGDSFDFYWLDDDHMVVYLLDVSGHGVESALIAVSVHNMLRSASFAKETMLEPDRVLAALNQQFGMDQHDDNYFTIFYGVYQRSSATLRYANAGHPPALLFSGAQVSELSSQSCPVGTFDDTSFATATVPLPPGSQMLLYSDGVFELPLDDGGQWSMRDFLDMCTRLGGSPDWTLDDVLHNVLGHSASGSFDDDCCLVRLSFD